VIWRDEIGVTCRRWNWRQCVRTRITGSTVNAVFTLDGLGPPAENRLITAGRDLAEQLTALNPGARLGWRQLGSGDRPADIALLP
jgi:DNA/RNA-binding domain of Phe-tRNA-synthetase-like protein